MECPTVRQITEKLGWFVHPSRSEYDLAIYGAGPVGLSAAVYGASEGLKTVLVEHWTVDGQAGSTSSIENYLGFPKASAAPSVRVSKPAVSGPKSCSRERACVPSFRRDEEWSIWPTVPV
jgi:hypothetical protein